MRSLTERDGTDARVGATHTRTKTKRIHVGGYYVCVCACVWRWFVYGGVAPEADLVCQILISSKIIAATCDMSPRSLKMFMAVCVCMQLRICNDRVSALAQN